MRCERCRRRPARVVVEDHPENDGAMLFGDETLGMYLCNPCLCETQADGPWSMVTRL